jgi:hypothetical protein
LSSLARRTRRSQKQRQARSSKKTPAEPATWAILSPIGEPTRLARRAGTNDAAIAMASKSAGTAANVIRAKPMSAAKV